MRIETLEGDDVRPTTDKVKEAMFSIVQFQLEGRRVLDLFAGSGQLGIESLSRGAAQAVFVDVSRQAVEQIKRNLNHTGLAQNALHLFFAGHAVFSLRVRSFPGALLEIRDRGGGDRYAGWLHRRHAVSG